MSEQARPCNLTTPGHALSNVQAFEVLSTPAIEVALTVDDDGWFTITADGTSARVWSHDPRRAAQALAESGGKAFLRGEACLSIPHDATRQSYFHIAADPTDCVYVDLIDLQRVANAFEQSLLDVAEDST